MCDEHVKIHSKSVEHVLTEPTASLDRKKCPIHKKLIEYYCLKDGACICVSCCIIGEHRGHKMEPLKDAFEKKKVTLRGVLDKLTSSRDHTEKKVQGLQEQRKDIQQKTSDKFTDLFRDIREQLDTLEKQVRSEIKKQEDHALLKVSDLIQQLEINKDDLSKEILHLEELCSTTDQITVLRYNEKEKNINLSKKGLDCDVKVSSSVNEAPISLILYQGLLGIGEIIQLKAKSHFNLPEVSAIYLDVKTAHNKIAVSKDLKSASYSSTSQKYTDGPERFKSCQILSMDRFSSGQHYWEVDVSEASRWIVGVASQSIERKVAGNDSFIGYNDKSWSLFFQKYLGVSHNNIQQTLDSDSPVQSVGIYLDYEAGRLSFYELCDPIRHLHTFTDTFTEPLHAAFYIFENSCIKLKS
ncbi:nuclear factor 7, ovary-like [Discoglossus pictus]